MKKFKFLWEGLGFALAVVAYVALVMAFTSNVQAVLGSGVPAFVSGMMILLLLVLSVAVVGSLIFGRPAYLYFGGAKHEGVILAASVMVWLLVSISIGLVIFVLLNVYA